MKIKTRYYFLIFISTLILWIIWTKINSKNNILTHESKTNFYYSPNDTHCPIAIFDEDSKKIDEINVEECNNQTTEWIYIADNFAIFNSSKVKEVGIIKCFYKEITWKTDFESFVGPWKEFKNNTELGNRIFQVQCKGQSLFSYYEQYLFGFENKRIKEKNDNLKDILIVGVDSVSRLAWKRLLGKSYNYLENEMKESSVIFKKVNVLGDGTTVNVLGILAGELEMEVYESRKGYAKANFVDDYPWIWKKLKAANYATFYDEDDVTYGTFQYRLVGFKRKPTDFYGRIWRMIHNLRKDSSLCMNHRNVFEYQLHYMKKFFETVKGPKFAFLWSTFFSHDSNENVRVLDKSLLSLLKEINEPQGVFNNTLFILMSDHGHRFNSRLHLQGKFEERLPFFSIHLPKSVIEEKPEIIGNLRKNEEKLITMLDAHESLKDLLENFTYSYKNDSKMYRMSLFYPNIPFRQCIDVKVATHWCSCLKWSEISIKEEGVEEGAQHMLTQINYETKEYGEKCHKLYIDKIIRADLIGPSKDVLRFHDSDKHGRVPNMSDNTKVDSFSYRIVLQTKPGDAIFESTINVKIRNKKREYNIKIQDIDRSNRYSPWIWCIDSTMRDVRKFCLCK